MLWCDEWAKNSGGGVASRISKLQQLNNHFDNKTHPLQTIIDFLLKSYLDLH